VKGRGDFFLGNMVAGAFNEAALPKKGAAPGFGAWLRQATAARMDFVLPRESQSPWRQVLARQWSSAEE